MKNGIVDTAIQMLIPIKNAKARPKYPMTAKYIAVHNAGNAGATGKTNAHYVVNQNEYKSWHFTIGNEEIYQHLPITESGWHAGDGVNGKGNRESIGVEIAEVYGAERTAVKFIAELMKATSIGIENVLPHKYFSGKNCPRLILPHWDRFIDDIKKELGEVNKVEYAVTPNKTHELIGNVEDLQVKIVNKNNRQITEKNCVNGTFFWNTTTPGEKYSTSILYAEGKLYKATANHFPNAQSVFIVYKNNTVEMKRIKNISELDLDNIRIAIGGIGLRNTLDSKFKYDPATEGFSGAYADVLRKTNKTVIGYNKKLNKIYLMCRPNIFHSSTSYDLLDLVRDCEYDIALSVDGGGSSCMFANGENAFKGDGRIIHNILCFI